MISYWDKKVLEQGKWRAEEGRAKRLLAWETKLFNGVDRLLCDTSCHADFFHAHMGVPREKLRVLFTGTDETVFKPADRPEDDPPHDPKAPLRILYHGAYLPLHGTEYIVEAARRTQGLNIHWDFLGWGAYKAATEEKAKGISNITFLERVPYVEVPRVIRTADIVLGVFGTTEKASRVIGNKVYEAMACCRPVINEFCTGYPPEAKDCPAITFVPPGDPQAIVPPSPSCPPATPRPSSMPSSPGSTAATNSSPCARLPATSSSTTSPWPSSSSNSPTSSPTSASDPPRFAILAAKET